MIEDLLKSGRYATASEVMREGLRLVEEREERRKVKLEALRAEIQKGIDSRPAEEVDLSEWMDASSSEDGKDWLRENVTNKLRKSPRPTAISIRYGILSRPTIPMSRNGRSTVSEKSFRC